MSARVALVTGAARRLGAAIARRLAAGGRTVAVHYGRSEAEAREVVRAIKDAGGRAEAFGADLRTAAGAEGLVAAVVERLGPIADLVHNASVFSPTPTEEITAEDFRRFQAVHAEGGFFLARAAGRGLRAAPGGGAVVLMGDIWGWKPLPRHLPYSLSKAAVLMLARALARELAPEVRVNAVAPGAILWPEGMPEATREKLLARIPAGRTGTPDEIAATVEFLLEARYVTGQVVAVDGGRSIEP